MSYLGIELHWLPIIIHTAHRHRLFPALTTHYKQIQAHLPRIHATPFSVSQPWWRRRNWRRSIHLAQRSSCPPQESPARWPWPDSSTWRGDLYHPQQHKLDLIPDSVTNTLGDTLEVHVSTKSDIYWKTSTGRTGNLRVAYDTTTIKDLQALIEERTSLPAEQQNLKYAYNGLELESQSKTLAEYGIPSVPKEPATIITCESPSLLTPQ